MRQQVDSSRLRGAPALMPVAVAGSIALLLGAAPSPALAVESAADHHRSPRAPGSTSPAAASTARVPTAASPSTYTVQRGDTVFGIAARYGLRTADVLALNGLTSSSIIRPGQVLRLTGAAPAAAPAPAAPVASAGTYTVQKGDTLSAIAGRHGVTIKALFAANGLGWASIIYPGQKLTLPGGQAPAAKPAAPAPAPAPQAPVAASGVYTVQKGDTLSSIAQRNGVTVQTLFAANRLGWGSIIYPGQKIALNVPPAAVAAAPTAPAPKPIPTLDAEQRANAQLIIRVGRELGVPDRGLAIALAAAMQESSLRNLAGGRS